MVLGSGKCLRWQHQRLIGSKIFSQPSIGFLYLGNFANSILTLLTLFFHLLFKFFLGKQAAQEHLSHQKTTTNQTILLKKLVQSLLYQ